MLTLAVNLASHLQLDTTKLQVCWAVTRLDGTVLRGTAHDRDIVITIGTYAGTYRAATAVMSSAVRSSSDGSVQNLEVEGAFQTDVSVPDITVEEIEGGVYDQARAVLLMLNWSVPDDGQKVLCAGTLGEFYRDSNGRYRSEVRGLTQALQQNIVQTYSERCNVALLGDSRCKFDVASVTRTGTVSSVTNRKTFVVTLDAGPAPVNATYYNGGRLVFTSGDNNGFIREIKTATLVGSDLTITLWDEAPADIAIGVTVSVPPGCDRRLETCRDVFDNVVNMRAPGLHAAGRDRLMKGPT